MLRYSASPPAETRNATPRTPVFQIFTVVAALSVVLRIWYAGSLYQDDGLWFTAAEEILRGKALYRDIFFDKPPGLPLLYAGLFKIFGAHILTIRLFTICYTVLISALLFPFGSRVYDKRAGLIAAVMFSVFSTTYISGDMQSLNTDLLMTPFYSASAFLMIRSGSAPSRSAWLALAGGAISAVGFQINPKAAFNLLFFALFLIAARCWNSGTTIKYLASALKLFAFAVTGFVFASVPFLLYISGTHSLSRYKLYVWEWGLRYTAYYPASRAARIFLYYGTDYFLINNLLLITLVVVAGSTISRALQYARERRSTPPDQAPPERNPNKASGIFQADVALLIWFAVSLVGVAAGGRFFAHYYFQVLPSLCLIGASGLVALASWFRAGNRLVRAIVAVLLVIGFGYTLVRSHSETVRLASSWIRGGKTDINREARLAAATVRDAPDPIDAVDGGGVETIRQGGPRTRPAGGAADYLFVWGNWPEVYYWSGLIPASGYLSSQPLTGVPADVWYGSEEYRLILDEKTTGAARAELVRELEQTPPKYIIDELGFRDERLSIDRYSELREFLGNYERFSARTNVPIWVLRSER
ncbi:MAG TPA: glycosyltransferase family 39 protein [Blastocatellia bacterium]|nr:glycosyltransferase family 39 protein [Blastocatellia bacterium]